MPSSAAATSSARKSKGKVKSKSPPKSASKATSKAATKSAGTKAKAKAQPVAAKEPIAPPKEVAAAPAPGAEEAPSDAVQALEAVQAAFAASHARYQQLSAAVSAARSENRALEKQVVRALRAAEKANARRRKKASTRAPSGFVKPTPISDKLAKFLGKEVGTEMARTEVTRELNAYIREHNLQDKNNGRKINADASLRDLLQLSDKDELTYFNLQKYMSPHFAKAESSSSSA